MEGLGGRNLLDHLFELVLRFHVHPQVTGNEASHATQFLPGLAPPVSHGQSDTFSHDGHDRSKHE